MPSKSFTWDVAITIAAADVKPAETGPDMKSIRKPLQDEIKKKKNTLQSVIICSEQMRCGYIIGAAYQYPLPEYVYAFPLFFYTFFFFCLSV